MHLVRKYRARTGAAAAPVPYVDGVYGDFTPGAILSTSPALPPAPTAPRVRTSSTAPPGTPLVSACTALAAGELQVTTDLRCEGYTAACQVTRVTGQPVRLLRHTLCADSPP